MSQRERQLAAIHAAIGAAIGVSPSILRRETRIYEDVSPDPVSLRAVLDTLEARFSIDFSLGAVACLHGNGALTVGDLVDAVDEAIERAAVGLEEGFA